MACTTGVEGEFSSVGTAINDGTSQSFSVSTQASTSSVSSNPFGGVSSEDASQSTPVSSSVSTASSSSSVVIFDQALSLNYKWPDEQTENVALANEIEIEFSEALAQETNLNTLFSVSQGGQAVSGTVSTNDNRLFKFKPNALLAAESEITVQIPSGLRSSIGSVFPGEQWQFTTTVDVYDTPQDVVDLCMNDLDLEMLAAVNAARSGDRFCTSETANDFKPAVEKLRWSCTIQQASIAHSEDMAYNNFFSHTSSDGSSLRDRIDRTGYNWWTIGENIAAGQRSVNEVMAGWLESYGHCINIMAPQFTEFGFGYIQVDTGYRRYWTQNFATPR